MLRRAVLHAAFGAKGVTGKAPHVIIGFTSICITISLTLSYRLAISSKIN